MAGGEATRCVALLRGVNVGGVKVLMGPLEQLAETLGWTEVRTYIASGNLVFSAEGWNDELAERLRVAVKDVLGLDTLIFVLTGEEIRAVLAGHPWEPVKGNQSHVYFCWDEPTLDADLYRSLKAADEELRVVAGHVHFLAPGGIGRSRLAEKLGKVIRGTDVTGRNLNTVRKLVKMVSA